MEGSKALPKIPKKSKLRLSVIRLPGSFIQCVFVDVAKELLTDFNEKDAIEREHINSLIKSAAGIRNNPETGYEIDELKHVNNPALEKDFKYSHVHN